MLAFVLKVTIGAAETALPTTFLRLAFERPSFTAARLDTFQALLCLLGSMDFLGRR
ncbi:UNVERIFIED_ORG: hypothetical protein GGE44_001097 [Rhizobium esperanzae]